MEGGLCINRNQSFTRCDGYLKIGVIKLYYRCDSVNDVIELHFRTAYVVMQIAIRIQFSNQIEGLHERTEHLDIFLFHPSLSGVLFPMFCLLVVERECQILVF